MVPPAVENSVEPSRWVVVYHEEAVVEFEALRDKKQRKGVLTIVSILRQIGPKIVEPLAIAPDAVVDASGFKSAVKRAQRRAKDDYGFNL